MRETGEVIEEEPAVIANDDPPPTDDHEDTDHLARLSDPDVLAEVEALEADPAKGAKV